MKRIYILEAAGWTDEKTGKDVSWEDGYPSDGASGPANDIVSFSWKAHDVGCDRAVWDDGTPMTPRDCSRILKDILMIEGRWFRAYLWGPSTWLWTSVRGIGNYPARPLHPELAGEMLLVTKKEYNRMMGTHNLKSRAKHWTKKRRVLRQDKRVLQRNVPYED